jgi:hypothetical protein
MLIRMEKRELWSARVRDWRASGKSMSEFSRGEEFTAAGLSYWVRRLASEAAPSAKSLRLARVVCTHGGTRSEPASSDTPRTGSAACWLVVEAGALRVHVSELLDSARLEAVLIAVGRAAKAGGA